MIRRKKRKINASLGLQSGSVEENLPSTSFGTEVGTLLGKSRKGQLAITYAQASCSCGGENQKCFRCNGTGFYTRQVVPLVPSATTPLSSKLRSNNQPASEASFSNDYRGDAFGIRERGRFSSSPLYDDYD